MMKYYDPKLNKVLIPPEGGCDMIEWIKGAVGYSYATHKDGFLVFLSAGEMEQRDEYKHGDPFGIEDSMDSNFHRGRVNTTINLLNKMIRSSGTPVQLLDVGCGQGHIAAKVKKALPQIEVTGIDLSITAIQYAHQHYKNIDFVVGDACNPPFVESFYDIIICNNTWEHVADPVQMLFNLKKILKKDGIIIMSTPSRYRTANLLKVLLGKKPTINKHHITEFSVGQILEQFDFCGYSVEKIHAIEVKGQGGSVLSKILIHTLFKTVIKIWIRITNSNHVLDSTVFYLAKSK